MTVKFKCPRRGCDGHRDHPFTTAPLCPKCQTRMVKAQPDAKAPSSKGYVKSGVSNTIILKGK